MKLPKSKKNQGFSLLELIISMTITLTLLGVVSTLLVGAIGTRDRESRRTDAMTSAQAALNVMSREIANAGYGLTNNGIVTADSNTQKLHIRSNTQNNDLVTNSPGEDVMYYFNEDTDSIIRYDANDNPQMSVVINRVSNITFQYFDYIGNSSIPTQQVIPTNNTGRVRINVTVQLPPVQGQPDNDTVTFTSDVTLRNSNYMLNQY